MSDTASSPAGAPATSMEASASASNPHTELELRKLRAEIANLERPWYRTNWVALVTSVVAILGVGIQWVRSDLEFRQAKIDAAQAKFDRDVIARETAALEVRRDKHKSEIATLETEAVALRATIAQLNAERARLASLATTVVGRGTETVSWEDARAAIEQRLPADANALPPRVYILGHHGSDRRVTETVSKQLQSSGYVVPFIKFTARNPQEAQVRYYFDTDRDEAQRIADLVSKSGISATAQKIASPNVARRRHYELWLKNES